ncbi:MAG TPA: alkaline phosphatase family protein [Acidimicrobiales bacterium]|nr:alkaline phosphatase family protein [Acidimicrobiales bacterium]
MTLATPFRRRRRLAPGRPRRWGPAAAVAALGLALAACGGASTATPTTVAAGPPTPNACGRRTTPPRYRHVIWIWMENHSLSQVIGSSDAPFETALAGTCGLATNYHAITHPSLPNYVAATAGSTLGVSDDAGPAQHHLPGPSLFGELDAAGRSWRGYDESMPGHCATSDSGEYATRHNPAVYYAGLRPACQRFDLPMGTTTAGALHDALQSASLPSFSFITPNVCNDDHSCPVRTGDAWLARWVTAIVASPAYRAGNTVVMITWDEGSGNNHVPLIVVSPSTRPGTRAGGRFDHYSLLRTTADLLGVRPPGKAATAASLASAFNL